ncbi:MAG: hypothetical protein ACR2PL_10885 [Dehalococcoidia bacterium]
MRLPRELSGDELVTLFRRYGSIRTGTLSGILDDVAGYQQMERAALQQKLFG